MTHKRESPGVAGHLRHGADAPYPFCEAVRRVRIYGCRDGIRLVLHLHQRKGAMTMNPNKALWEKGDFTRIAESMRESGEALVMTLGITDGLEVLDLGCGDGTTALPAARLGADVLGVDIASNLVEAGNARAQSLGLTNCRFQEGDASDLSELEDDSFDLVVSIFGAMFAPRPFDVAKEVVRVTRPGGRIVMGNWIPNDPTLVAQILKISSSYSPPPPEGFVSPMTWGVEDNVIERFAGAGVPEEKISFERDTYTFNFPGAPSETSCGVQDVLRADHERVRSCSSQRPRGRSAGRAGRPLQRPERKPE
jgi:SAM-dependent methyltransferase